VGLTGSAAPSKPEEELAGPALVEEEAAEDPPEHPSSGSATSRAVVTASEAIHGRERTRLRVFEELARPSSSLPARDGAILCEVSMNPDHDLGVSR
jgi:hypothetical protein